MTRVAIIGAGVGGLAGAIRLANSGHEVTMFERNASVGGKLAGRTIDGFTWDTGPSLLTLPHLFDELFALGGTSLAEQLTLDRLEPTFRYRFADGTTFDSHDAIADSQEAIEAFAGGGDEWLALMKRAERIWQISEQAFFVGAMDSPLALLKRLKSPRDLFEIDSLSTLAKRSAKTFTDERLRMWLNRYATYSGSDPYKTPATLACIPFIEQHFGAWHIRGGLHLLADALAKVARQLGVTIRTQCNVAAVRVNGRNVDGVVVNNETQRFDVVVANCDAEHLYRDLLPTHGRLKRVARAGRSSSGFALLLGLDGVTPGLAHHNVWFSGDQRKEFRQIFAEGGVADDPTIYVCCSAVTDSSQAPADKENWFVLTNVGAGVQADWKSHRDRIVDKLGIASRIEVSEIITPADLAFNYRSPGGAIYGTSSNSRRSAFLRASNRGPVRGLYLLGGSSHPGGGLPLVAMSGRIVADMINEDYS